MNHIVHKGYIISAFSGKSGLKVSLTLLTVLFLTGQFIRIFEENRYFFDVENKNGRKLKKMGGKETEISCQVSMLQLSKVEYSLFIGLAQTPEIQKPIFCVLECRLDIQIIHNNFEK